MRTEDFYIPDTDRMVNSISRAYQIRISKVSNMAAKLKSIVDAEGESFYDCTNEEEFLSKYKEEFEPNAAICLFHFIESSAAHYILNQPSGKWNKTMEEEIKNYCRGNSHLTKAFDFLGKCVAYSVGIEVFFSSVSSPHWPSPSMYKK